MKNKISVMRNKKGIALNQAFGAVLTLVLVAVLVIVAILIFVNLGATFVNESVSVTVESLTPPALVSNSTNCNFNSFSLTTALNASGTTINIAGNISTTSAGLVTNTTLPGNNTQTPWILNYTALAGGAACVATDVTIVQFGTYPVLIGLVGTIIFLGLVIGVLVASFVFGRNRGV